MATGYQTQDADQLAYIDATIALAAAGDESGAFERANAVIRISSFGVGFTLSKSDRDLLWANIALALATAQ